jgi:hypothetical protein
MFLSNNYRTYCLCYCNSSIFRRSRKILYLPVCLSVRPSVCPHGTIRLPLEGILCNFIFYFFKICRTSKFKFHYVKTNIYFWSYLFKFFFKWEKFQRKFVEKIKTHDLCSKSFSRKSYPLWNKVENYSTALWAIYGNMAHANCMLDKGYKHTLRISNTYCFSTAGIFAWGLRCM